MDSLGGILLNYSIQVAKGLEVTLSIFAVSLILSIPLGVGVALCRLSRVGIIRKAAEMYIWILRGTPLLLQIIFIFFGLPLIDVTINLGIPIHIRPIFDRMPSVYIAFVLNYAAYFGEIFRSGIQSIERGQTEAACILGFTPWQINTKIIMPQVIKRTLPSIGNEVITLAKDTSLAYIVGVDDVIKLTKGIANRDGTIIVFVIAAAIYLILTYIITKIFDKIEKKVMYKE